MGLTELEKDKEFKFFKPFSLPQNPTHPDRTVSICDFGAVENCDCTKSIRAAIDHLAEKGGGRVIVPRGNWSTGAIHLKSNIHLHFEEGAHVSFSTNPEDYLPVVLCVFEGVRCYNYSPFIYGINLENVSVTGKGYLEGNGEAWWPWKKRPAGLQELYMAGRDEKPLEERVYGTEEAAIRSAFVQFLYCKNVLLEGFTLHNSPFWNVDPVWCENLIVRDITIESPFHSPNTDGINIDACKNVLVEDCTVVSAGDDLFCLKAGRNEDARAVGIPCENVVIRRCKALGDCNSGGIVIGSEMSAGVRNILAYDCEFTNNQNGIRIKSKDGRGGIIEDIECRNIHTKKAYRGINLSFRYEDVRSYDAPKKPGAYMPIYRRMYFKDISCDDAEFGIAIDGVVGGRMEDIYMENISMRAQKCLTADSVEGLHFTNVNLTQIEREQ